MSVTNVPMVALVLKLTVPLHVTVLKDSQASIVERKVAFKIFLENFLFADITTLSYDLTSQITK